MTADWRPLRDSVSDWTAAAPAERPADVAYSILFEVMMMKCCLMSSYVIWHIRDKLWPMPKHGSINLYVHGNPRAALRRLVVRTDSPGHPAPRLSHSSSWFDVVVKCCFMSSDISWHIRDKLWPMPKTVQVNKSLRPRKPEGSLGRTAAQDVRRTSTLSHTVSSWTIWFDVDDDELMLNVLRCHETY